MPGLRRTSVEQAHFPGEDLSLQSHDMHRLRGILPLPVPAMFSVLFGSCRWGRIRRHCAGDRRPYAALQQRQWLCHRHASLAQCTVCQQLHIASCLQRMAMRWHTIGQLIDQVCEDVQLRESRSSLEQ